MVHPDTKVFFTFLFILCVYIITVSFYQVSYKEEKFNGFNNDTGTQSGCYIVPNIVHFLRFNDSQLSFPEAVCILAAYKNQKPDQIIIHTNVKQTGKYWKIVRSVKGINETLTFSQVDLPREIYGQTLNKKWRVFHGGDVTRIRILLKYGGIFLDNDSYIVRSLNHFRHFEMALGWQEGKSLQNQVVVAHKDARFLKLWLESYRDSYKPTLWYYNAGELPTRILENRPYLVHRVPQLFGVYGVVRKIFEKQFLEWEAYYAFHLMVRHQYLLKNVTREATYPVRFNERNIHKYPIAFRDMVYQVYPFKKNVIKQKKKKIKNYFCFFYNLSTTKFFFITKYVF